MEDQIQRLKEKLADDVIATLRSQSLWKIWSLVLFASKIEATTTQHKIQVDIDLTVHLQELKEQKCDKKRTSTAKRVRFRKSGYNNKKHHSHRSYWKHSRVGKGDCWRPVSTRDSKRIEEENEKLFTEASDISVKTHFESFVSIVVWLFSAHIQKSIGPGEIYCNKCVFYLKYKADLMMDWKSGEGFCVPCFGTWLKKFLCEKANLHLNVLMIDEGFRL